MKRIMYFTTLSMLLITTPVSAKVLTSSYGNSEIAIGGANADISVFDYNGDGKADRGNLPFDRTKFVVGKADAKGIARHTQSELLVWGLVDPLTGKLKMKTKGISYVLTFDASATTPMVFSENGGGLFTVGTMRYYADIQSISSPVPAPMLRGTKYIDTALSIAIVNMKTGAVAKLVRLRSNPVWKLDPWQTRFSDINGATHLIVVWHRRPATLPVPIPGKTVISKELSRIEVWDAMHTRLVKKYFENTTNVMLP